MNNVQRMYTTYWNNVPRMYNSLDNYVQYLSDAAGGAWPATRVQSPGQKESEAALLRKYRLWRHASRRKMLSLPPGALCVVSAGAETPLVFIIMGTKIMNTSSQDSHQFMKCTVKCTIFVQKPVICVPKMYCVFTQIVQHVYTSGINNVHKCTNTRTLNVLRLYM